MPRWVSKALSVTPGLVVSTVLTIMVGAVLPPAAGLAVFLVGLGVAVLLAAGVGEAPAVRVLFRAQRLSAGQLLILGPALTLLCQQGLGPPLVEIRVRRGGPAVTAGGVGRHTVVVSCGLIEALGDAQLPPEQAAAVVAHAAAVVRGGWVRLDPLIAFWSWPWQVLRGFAAGVARAGAGVPLTSLAWRWRVLVMGIATVQTATTQGPRWLAVLLGALTTVSYAAPVWAAHWQQQLVDAGDVAIMDAGLGPALAAFLRRCPPCPGTRARISRLAPDQPGRPVLALVRTR